MKEALSLTADVTYAFDAFRATDTYRNFYEKVLTGERILSDRDTVGELHRRFAGGVYEWLAYQMVGDNIPQDTNLLSPDKTFAYYRKLHPGAKPNHYLFTSGLRDVSVPDGILHDADNNVLGVFEYTLLHDRRHFRESSEKKYKAFCSMRERFPETFRDASLVFVLPRSENQHPSRAFAHNPQDIEVILLPFNRMQLRHYVDSLLPPSALLPPAEAV